MTVDQEDDRVVVSRAIGKGTITEGTLVSLLEHVHRCGEDEAVEMLTMAHEEGVIEEVHPGVFRVSEGWRDDRWREVAGRTDSE